MDRKKFLKMPTPFGGFMPPYHKDGKAYIVYDTPKSIEHTSFLLRAALTDCRSSNPFQELGIDEAIIFSVQDGLGTSVMDAVSTVLDEFKDRLKTLRLEIAENPDDGEDVLLYEGEYLPFKVPVSLMKPLTSAE